MDTAEHTPTQEEAQKIDLRDTITGLLADLRDQPGDNWLKLSYDDLDDIRNKLNSIYRKVR